MTNLTTLVWLTSLTLVIWGAGLLIRARRQTESRRKLAHHFGVVLICISLAGAFATYRLIDVDTVAYGSGPFRAFQFGAITTLYLGVILTIWSYRGDRSRGRRRCPKCWYDMSGSELLCPECGRTVKVANALFKPRRRWRGVIAGLTLLLASYGLAIGPRVQRDGARGAVSTWFLITGLPWLPDSLIGSNSYAVEPGSLFQRWADAEIPSLERKFLEARVERLFRSSADLQTLARAEPFMIERSSEAIRGGYLSIARGLVSGDQLTVLRAKSVEQSLFQASPAMYVRFAPDPRAAPLLPGLHDLVASPDVSLKLSAFRCMMVVAPDDAVSTIFREVDLDVPEFCPMLRLIVQRSSTGTDLVLAQSKSPTREIRRACAFALGTGHAGDRETDRLVELLSDPDFGVQQCAATSLVASGREQDRVIPLVLRWACNPNLIDASPITEMARLSNLDLSWHATLLIPLLSHANYQIRQAAEDRLLSLADDSRLDLLDTLKPLSDLAAGEQSELSRRATDILDRYRLAPGRVSTTPVR